MLKLLMILSGFFMTVIPLMGAPVPGQWKITPDRLVSGENTIIDISYIHTGEALPAGTCYMLRLDNVSVKSLFHCRMSDAMEVLPYKGDLPHIELKPQRQSGIGIQDVIFEFPDGLKSGDSFKLRFGNQTPDGIVAIVNPFPMKKLTFAVFVAESAKSEYTDWYDLWGNSALPKCDICAAEPCMARVFLPSLVGPDDEFTMKVSVTDQFDSRPENGYKGILKVIDKGGIEGLPDEIVFDGRDNSYVQLDGLKASGLGVHRVKVDFKGKVIESNPIVVKNSVAEKIYWGTTHNHGEFSEGLGDDNDYALDFARYTSCLDFAAFADHFYQKPIADDTLGHMYKWSRQCYDVNRHQFMDFFKGRMLKLKYGRDFTLLDAWKASIEAADKANVDGQFTALCGYEWSSQEAGHYTVYMENMSEDNMDEVFLPYYSGYSADFLAHLRKSSALVIPHVSAFSLCWFSCPDNLYNRDGKLLLPVTEVYSDWGDSFSPFKGVNEPMNLTGGMRSKGALSVSEVFALGYKFALNGDADSHTGLLGRRVVGGGAIHHDHKAGLTAVSTTALTRRNVLDAYHDRKTYATTGERIYLEFSINNVSGGNELEIRGAQRLQGRVFVAGTDSISEVRIYCMDKIVRKFVPSGKDCEYTFMLDAPANGEHLTYTAEIVQMDENMAWSSPVWVKNIKGRKPRFNVVGDIEKMHAFPMPETKCILVWAQKLSADNRLTVSFRNGYDYPVKGEIKVYGAVVKGIEQNYALDRKLVNIQDSGVYSFRIESCGAMHKMNGFGMLLEVVSKDARIECTFGDKVEIINLLESSRPGVPADELSIDLVTD